MAEHGAATRILIAGDHAIFRAALRQLLQLDSGITVVGEAGDGRQARKLLEKLQPDVLLLNIPRQSGLDVLRQLTGVRTKTRIILVLAAAERQEIVEALRLGARGVLHKNTASELLYKCIRTVMAGEYWVDRNSLCDLVQTLSHFAGPVPESRQANAFGLTRRQSEILSAVMEGFTNKEIATRFHISEQTVKHHLSSIFEKVGVTNRMELALFAMNKHLFSEV